VQTSTKSPELCRCLVGHQVYIDRPGLCGSRDADTRGEQLRPAAPAAGAQHQLRGIDTACERQQGIWDIGTHNLVVGTPEVFDEHSLAGQMGRVSAAEAITTYNVYGEQIGPLSAAGDPRSAADQGIALGPTGQGHNHPLPGFPVGADVVIGAVLVELLVDLAGDPEQRQLA
jgi:hypothetical protein